MEPSIIGTLNESGGLVLVLLAGMGGGLVAIGKYIREEREKDRAEKERLAATFNGAITQQLQEHRQTVKDLSGDFRASLTENRRELKETFTEILDSLKGVHRP